MAGAALGLSSCLPFAVPPARADLGFGPYTAGRGPEPARTATARSPGSPGSRPPPLDEQGVLRLSAGLHLASAVRS